MIGLLISPAGRVIAGIAVAAMLFGGVYIKGRADGRASVLDRLAGDRITILKDGKAIDHEVLGADDDALCVLLGGCGVPDGAVRD